MNSLTLGPFTVVPCRCRIGGGGAPKAEASTVGVFTVYFEKSRTDTAHTVHLTPNRHVTESLALTTLKSCVRIEKRGMSCGLDDIGDEAHGDSRWKQRRSRTIDRSGSCFRVSHAEKRVPGRRSK